MSWKKSILLSEFHMKKESGINAGAGGGIWMAFPRDSL